MGRMTSIADAHRTLLHRPLGRRPVRRAVPTGALAAVCLAWSATARADGALPPRLPSNLLGSAPCVGSFLLALPFKLPVLLLLVRSGLKLDRERIRSDRLFSIGLIASAVTMPVIYITLAVAPAANDPFLRARLALEAGGSGIAILTNPLSWVIAGGLLVFATETMIYRVFLRLALRQAALLSLVSNTISFVAGLAIFGLMVW